jgi:hypothetical protein
MNATEVKATLQATGKAEVNGFEIWETKIGSSHVGSWSGQYRVAPSGSREQWRNYTPGDSCPLDIAIAIATSASN